MKCCGLDGKNDDYVKNVTTGGIMTSCCYNQAQPCTIANAYNHSCSFQLTLYLENIAKAIGGVVIGFGLIEVSIQ